MKLEKQVCSLELAKKLKELGVKQESLFWWCGMQVTVGSDVCGGFDCDIPDKWKKSGYAISAFTVAELGEILPRQIDFGFDIGGTKYWEVDHLNNETIQSMITKGLLEYSKPNNWHCIYRSYAVFGDQVRVNIDGETEVDARAAMLIYLLENKLIIL